MKYLSAKMLASCLLFMILGVLGCYQADLPQVAEVTPSEINLSQHTSKPVEITIYGQGFSDYVVSEGVGGDPFKSERYFYVRLRDSQGRIDRYLTDQQGRAALAWTPDRIDEIHAWLDVIQPSPLKPGEYAIEVILPGLRLLQSPFSLEVKGKLPGVDPDGNPPNDLDAGEPASQCIEVGLANLESVSHGISQNENGVWPQTCLGPICDCDHAVYQFEVERPGRYYLWGLVEKGANIVIEPTFYMMVDLYTPFIWDVLQCKSSALVWDTWLWNQVSSRDVGEYICDPMYVKDEISFDLEAGTHYITIWGRSGGMGLLKFVLRDDKHNFPKDFTFDVCNNLESPHTPQIQH